MYKVKRNILLNPGPATTTDTVKNALVVPDICPREQEFCGTIKDIRYNLKKIVHGDDTYTTVLFGGSGTAVMDSVLNSVVESDKKIAIIVNGAYGERFGKIASTYKINFVIIDFPWDKPADPKKIAEILKNEKDISYLAVTHHETTTGLLNPIMEIGELAKKYNCTFIVDAISSYAGIPIDIKENNIDFLLSTSNKCIQGMAGLAFIICKTSSLEKIKDYPKRSYYLDLYSQYQSLEKTGQTQFTPPVQVIYALQQAIKEYFEEGELNRYRRYTESWQVLRAGLEELGLKLLLKPEHESHILLTVIEPETPAFNFEKLHDQLYLKGFTIYPGKLYDKKTFRIANMGDINSDDIKQFLNNLKEVLNSFCD